MKKNFVIHKNCIGSKYSSVSDYIDSIVNKFPCYNINSRNVISLAEDVDAQNIVQRGFYDRFVKFGNGDINRLSEILGFNHNSVRYSFWKDFAALSLSDDGLALSSQKELSQHVARVIGEYPVYLLDSIAPEFVFPFFGAGDNVIFMGAFREDCVSYAVDTAKRFGINLRVSSKGTLSLFT